MGIITIKSKSKTMKYLLTLIISIITLFPVMCQDISESIINFKEKYNPLFSSESAIISIDYIKTYSIDASDTSYYFILDIKNKDLEVESISLGSTMFNLNWISTTARSNYSINKTQSKSILEKEKFVEFYDCMSKVHSYISKSERFKTIENSVVATCGVENISIGGEYNPKKTLGSKVIFYFKVGDEATYQMSMKQFQSIVKVFRDIKNDWLTKK